MSRGIALLFSRTFGTRWCGRSATPRPPLPPGKTRYPLYRRLGGPQGQSGRAENLVPTGIRSRTVQPVAQSLYRLSYPAHEFLLLLILFSKLECCVRWRKLKVSLYTSRRFRGCGVKAPVVLKLGII